MIGKEEFVQKLQSQIDDGDKVVVRYTVEIYALRPKNVFVKQTRYADLTLSARRRDIDSEIEWFVNHEFFLFRRFDEEEFNELVSSIKAIDGAVAIVEYCVPKSRFSLRLIDRVVVPFSEVDRYLDPQYAITREKVIQFFEKGE